MYRKKTFRQKLADAKDFPRVEPLRGGMPRLARRHSTTIACPIVTGIHARIAAGAAGEAQVEGAIRVTPYWRTLKTGGELNEKYPGGLSAQRRRLEAERLRVEARGRRLFVRDHARFLAQLP